MRIVDSAAPFVPLLRGRPSRPVQGQGRVIDSDSPRCLQPVAVLSNESDVRAIFRPPPSEKLGGGRVTGLPAGITEMSLHWSNSV
jgi:hypothetical protein